MTGFDSPQVRAEVVRDALQYRLLIMAGHYPMVAVVLHRRAINHPLRPVMRDLYRRGRERTRNDEV